MFDGLVKQLAGRRLRISSSLPQKQRVQLVGGGAGEAKEKIGFGGNVQLVWKSAEILTASNTEVDKISFSTALILER